VSLGLVVLLRIIIPDDVEPKTYTAELILQTTDEIITIPIILEITKKIQEKIVDIKIQPLQRTLQPGDTLTIQTDIFNLGIKQPLEITLTIELVDSEGTIIFSTDQNLSVDTATTTTHTIPLPQDLQAGTYTVIGRATYLREGIEQQTESVAEIEVQKTALELLKTFMFKKYGIVRIWQILMLIPILILSTYAYHEYKKAARKRRRYNFLIEYGSLPKRGTNTAHVGNIAETRIKAHIDLNKLQTHTIVAGATGSGKTVAAQTIVEEALRKNIAVIVFDPTAQWTGFLRKCKDKEMLAKYSKYGLKNKDAKAFQGNIKQITDPLELIDLQKIMQPGKINILALNKLEPKETDTFIANSVSALFKANLQESKELKVLLVYDEVHRLLNKFGGSGEGLIQIERAARECRKWGIGILLISQVLSDFVGEIKANIATQIQLRTSDDDDLDRIKTKYGDEFVKSVVKSAVGTGMLENAEYNKGRAYFISFRPLLHSTTRLPDKELEQYNQFNNEVACS